MQLNHFIPAVSVVEMHAILLNDKGDMIFSGPLNAITELAFNQAKTSLVNPKTLQWIKQQADDAIRTKRFQP